MDKSHIHPIIKILKKELHVGEMPIVSHLAESERDPFVILISTLLSLRTKDEVTAEATDRLLALASTPEEMLRVPGTKSPGLSIRLVFTETRQKPFTMSAGN